MLHTTSRRPTGTWHMAQVLGCASHDTSRPVACCTFRITLTAYMCHLLRQAQHGPVAPAVLYTITIEDSYQERSRAFAAAFQGHIGGLSRGHRVHIRQLQLIVEDLTGHVSAAQAAQQGAGNELLARVPELTDARRAPPLTPVPDLLLDNAAMEDLDSSLSGDSWSRFDATVCMLHKPQDTGVIRQSW